MSAEGFAEHDQPHDSNSALLGLPDVSHLELDQLCAELSRRAQGAMAAQHRMRGLLAANRLIIGDLELPTVLHRMVDAACRLVHARYGAFAVVSPDGVLERFVHVGIDDETVALIGDLPECKGVLGALIQDPRPIRLNSITEHPRSAGFPPHHPTMTSFLGVPVRVRDRVFGGLYLADRDGGQFSAEDEELVSALAATGGVAIENARLFEQSKRREQWLQAATAISGRLLSGDGEEPLRVIAEHARRVASADVVTIVLPTPDGRQLMIEVASGRGADELTGVSFPIKHTLAGLAFAESRPVLIDDVTADDSYHVHLSHVVPIGPAMVLPLTGTSRARGALVIGRVHGRRGFDRSDLGVATTFANQAVLALELADAREDQQRVMLLEDRERIARDLHDHVIQRLFATGLSVQGVATALTGANGDGAERLEQVVAELDETIRQIRTSIFDLRGPFGPRTNPMRVTLSAVVAEMSPLLGFEPRTRFSGPIDAALPDELVADVAAVLREALTNVARHAHATRAEVEVDAAATGVSIQISDDGVGIGVRQQFSGLDNLRTRAEAHGGSLTVAAGAPGRAPSEREGTRLRWTVPLS